MKDNNFKSRESILKENNLTGFVLDKVFTLQKIIGVGGSSLVYSADANGHPIAVKILKTTRNYTRKYAESLIYRECKIVEFGEHPNLIKVLGYSSKGNASNVLESHEVKYIIYDRGLTPTLSDIIKYTGGLGETGKLLFFQLGGAIEFLHQQNGGHLDIKLQNVLLDKNYNVKLSDFGGGTFEQNDKFEGKRGTYGYMAPEVANLKGNEVYNPYSADIYSLGVCLFVLVTGGLPNIKGDNEANGHSTGSSLGMGTNGQSSLSYEEIIIPSWVSETLELLLESMLGADPSKRPSISNILLDPWFEGINDQELIYDTVEEMSSRLDFISKRI